MPHLFRRTQIPFFRMSQLAVAARQHVEWYEDYVRRYPSRAALSRRLLASRYLKWASCSMTP